MPISAIFENSATIGATEYSLPANANYSSGSPQTGDGAVQGWIDFSAITALADVFLIKVYEKVVSGGTQRAIEEYTIQYPVVFILERGLILLNGWDVSVTKISGTDRSIGWSLRAVTTS